MSDYSSLQDWLQEQTANRILVTLGQVEEILHFGLPNTARLRSQWWENNATHHVQANAWLNVGFHTEQVNLQNQTLVFVRT